MAAHHGVVMNSANQLAFGSIMRAAMIVDPNAITQPQVGNQPLAIEHHVEKRPDVALIRPGPSHRVRLLASLAQQVFDASQVLANARDAVQSRRLAVPTLVQQADQSRGDYGQSAAGEGDIRLRGTALRISCHPSSAIAMG